MSSSQERESGDRMHALIRGAWIGFGVGIALFLLAVGFERVTAAPWLCESCHEISPKVEAWRVAPHAQVGCQDCHQEPRPWYRYPETVADRWTKVARDYSAHVAFSEDSTGSPLDDIEPEIPDERCLRCHDGNREVTARQGTLIDHADHAERNDSCLSCHWWTAHPDPDADSALLFMRRCYDCHSREEEAEAPGTCDVCHPAEFGLEPESHEPDEWKDVHGDGFLADPGGCSMCHDESFCTDCHGVEMPHPGDWAGEEPIHGETATRQRDVCDRCHGSTEDYCTKCHHEAYDPGAGTWVDQHSMQAVEGDAAICTGCHVPIFCVDCHTLDTVSS